MSKEAISIKKLYTKNFLEQKTACRPGFLNFSKKSVQKNTFWTYFGYFESDLLSLDLRLLEKYYLKIFRFRFGVQKN